MFPIDDVAVIGRIRVADIVPGTESLGDLTSGIVIVDEHRARVIIGNAPFGREGSYDLTVGVRELSGDGWRWWRIQDFGGLRDLYLIRVDYDLDILLEPAELESLDLAAWPEDRYFTYSDFMPGVVVVPRLREQIVDFSLEFAHDSHPHDQLPRPTIRDFNWEVLVDQRTLRCTNDPDFIAEELELA